MASVTYRIGGKYDDSALKKAEKSVQGFQKALNAVKGAAIIGTITAVTKAAANCELAFLEANKAVQRIDFATSINKNLGETSASLKKFSAETSASLRGAFSVDEINAEIAKLSFDKTGEQIRRIIPAALDLSAAMGTSLSDAVTQLNNTFSGTTGTLGKMFPELKELSKDALESGEAINVIASKTQGMASVMADSGVGSVNAYKNALDNLKEAIGQSATTFFTPLRDGLTKVIEKITEAITKTNELKNAYKQISSGKASEESYDKVIADLQAEMKANSAMMKDANADLLQGLRNRNNELQQTINKLKIAQAESKQAQVRQQEKTTQSQKQNTALEKASESIAEVGKAAEKSADAQKKATSAIEDLGLAAEYAAEEERRQRTEAQGQALESSVFSGLGELGNVIVQGINLGAVGVIAEIITIIMNQLSEISEKFLYIINIVSNLVSVFIEPLLEPLERYIDFILRFIEKLGPVIDAIFKVVASLWDCNVMILEAFTPMFNLAVNSLKVIATVIITISDIITNIITAIYNAIISVYNFFSKKDKDKRSYRSIKDDVRAIWDTDKTYVKDFSGLASAQVEASSGSASYTAAKDVYVNIYYNNSYVNGDTRQIALSIRDEIKKAEKLGY